MTSSCLTILLSGLVLFPAFTFIDAYGHGVHGVGRIVIQDEQFSDNRATTSDIITVTGQIESRVNMTRKLSPYIYVTPREVIEFGDGARIGGIPWYAYLLEIIYPPIKDQSSWYFKVEHSLPNPVMLEPGESLPYEIKLYPHKTGSFHVHTYFIADDWRIFGRGQTVGITGETAPTFEEITQLYLPLALGATAAASLTVITIQRTRGEKATEKGIRVFFAIKSSFETLWLFGISFWLAAFFPYLYSFETKYAMVIGMTAALAAIPFGGYVATVSRVRNRQRLFAIGTSAATVLFYIALGYDYTAVGNQFAQFGQNGSVWFIAIIANTIASILITVIALRENPYTPIAAFWRLKKND